MKNLVYKSHFVIRVNYQEIVIAKKNVELYDLIMTAYEKNQIKEKSIRK